MRKPVLAVVFSVLALLLTACDSTQPLQGGARSIDVYFDTGVTSAPAFALYETWLDTDLDGEPDTQETVLYNPDGTGNIAVPRIQCDLLSYTMPTKTPWHYTGTLRVLRAASTSQEIVAESTLAKLSMTDYDQTPATEAPPRDPDLPPFGRFFLNGKIYAAGSSEAILHCEKIPQGLRLPSQNTFGTPGAYGMVLNPGDSVLVEILKSNIPVSLRLGSPQFVSRVVSNGTVVPDGDIVGDHFSDETNRMFFTYTVE